MKLTVALNTVFMGNALRRDEKVLSHATKRAADATAAARHAQGIADALNEEVRTLRANLELRRRELAIAKRNQKAGVK